MKRPTYYLKYELKEGEDTFQPFTIIQPIDDIYVPEHHMEKLKEARRFNINSSGYKMCIIGMHWICVPNDYIIERY
jgi:hypothetical protein